MPVVSFSTHLSVPDWVVLKGMLVELFSTQLHRLMDNFLQFHGGVLQIATRRVMAYLPNRCQSGKLIVFMVTSSWAGKL